MSNHQVKTSIKYFYSFIDRPMALYVFNSLDILTIWLRDTVLAQNSQPYFSFLILANLAMLIQFPLYQILIAKEFQNIIIFWFACVGIILQHILTYLQTAYSLKLLNFIYFFRAS